MFIAPLFTIAKTWKQPRCLLKRNGYRECGTYTLWNTTHIHNSIYTMQYLLKRMKSSICSIIVVIQSLNPVQHFANPGTAAHQASLSFTISKNLFKLMSIELMMPSNHLILCRPLVLPPIFLSIRVFSNESVICIRWPEYWSFNFSISPFNEYSGLISFRIDWFDLLAVQGTLKSLLQDHDLKASVFWCSAFFMVNFHTHTWLLEKP